LKLENRFRNAGEHYVDLLEYDKMRRDTRASASELDGAINRARQRRNAAGRLFLDHRIKHAASSRHKREQGEAVKPAAKVRRFDLASGR
jgi:hypothetical protein